MRNSPGGGKHLLRVASRAVGSSALGGASTTSSTSAPAAAAASSGGRSRPRSGGGGLPLRATSPPPPSAVAASAWWDSRNLRRDGEEDWEEVVAATAAGAGAGEDVEEVVEADAAEEVAEEDYRLVFGCPPTNDEVRAAVSSIQQMFENPFCVDSDHFSVDSDAPWKETAPLAISGHSSAGNSTESDDWIEPAMHVMNSTTLLTREHRNVLDAFRLLQIDPSVQKMVMALSSDKTVWDAVMNNEAVQEFQRSFHDANETESDEKPTGAAGVLTWILGSTQAKFMEFIDKITKLVNMLFHFHPQGNDEKPDFYHDAVRMSFMLSVFVFIVVAVSRVK